MEQKITLTRVTDATGSDYLFTEELLTTAFPPDEYRPLPAQRHNAAHEPTFHLMIARNGNNPVGFISYWQLNGICYVEHLATTPAERGKGHGSAILAKMQKLVGTTVLEVETPTDTISRRRIEFYKRQGFELCSTPYTQPPYCESGNSIPMFLMFRGAKPTKELFEETKKEIYSKIYSYKE